MINLTRGPPQLDNLIDMVLKHNTELINKWMEMGVDVMSIDNDFGAQDRLMLSPPILPKVSVPHLYMYVQECLRS